MILDRRDIELLTLAGLYRWLPFDKLSHYGFPGFVDAAVSLAKNGYVSIARNKLYLTPAARGYDTLAGLGQPFNLAARRAYTGSATLRRRLEVAAIMLTCLRAGIDTRHTETDGLSRQPVFLPAFALRTGGGGVMANANCAGFGHWGDAAYMLHYVSPESYGLYLMSELSIFHRLASVFSSGLDTPKALIFAGESYRQVYEQLQSQALSKRNGIRGFTDFAAAWRQVDLPIHLLSCDETGAMQLALMRQKDYNARIASTAYRSSWRPCDPEIPDADGSVGGHPLVIAADMNIRRVGKAVADARRLKRPKVMIAAFQKQLESFLAAVFPSGDMVTHFCIDRPILEAAFSQSFFLYAGKVPDASGGEFTYD